MIGAIVFCRNDNLFLSINCQRVQVVWWGRVSYFLQFQIGLNSTPMTKFNFEVELN